MIHIIWEFQIDPLQASKFEEIYGSWGAWSLLFQQSKDYHGTTLLKDSTMPGRYFTIDQWAKLDAFESFKAEHINAYNDLDHECEKLILIERKIGIFKNV
jgi:hypothetical protein